LDLNGTFEERERCDVILGITSNGKSVTLKECHLISSKGEIIRGYKISTFVISVIFIGAHFSKPEDIRFKSLSINYSYLEEWIGKRLFESQTIHEEGKFKEHHLKYIRPEPIKIETEYLSIQLIYRFGYSVSSYKIPEINSKAFVRIESKAELPFEEWFSIIYHIRNFLSLAMTSTGEVVYPLIIEGESERVIEMMTDAGPIFAPVKIIPCFGELIVLPKDREIQYWDILFGFNAISRQSEIYFQNWFSKSELLKPIYDLFFSTLYDPQMYITNQFLNLVQAIESYHRRTMRNNDLPQEEYNKRVSEILDKIPREYANWFKEKMEYRNEPTLRKRLKEIIDAFEIQEFFDDEKDIKMFVNKVVITRNYLVHYDKGLEDKALPPERLFPYVQRLRTILLACLLKEIGFELGEIKSMVRKYFERYVHHLTLHK